MTALYTLVRPWTAAPRHSRRLRRTGPTDFIKDRLRTPHRLGSLREAIPW